jgi:hypothetical protein
VDSGEDADTGSGEEETDSTEAGTSSPAIGTASGGNGLTVFQAAGPTVVSIQSTVDAFRAAVGDPNNGNAVDIINPAGRREINWDGGGNVDATTPPVTPFDVFLNSRGARFTTPGTGLSQAALAGLVTLFTNATYGTTFGAFSPLRLFTPVDSNVTHALFFVPGTDGGTPALVRGFGAVFTDVDQPDGSWLGNKKRAEAAGQAR